MPKNNNLPFQIPVWANGEEKLNVRVKYCFNLPQLYKNRPSASFNPCCAGSLALSNDASHTSSHRFSPDLSIGLITTQFALN